MIDNIAEVARQRFGQGTRLEKLLSVKRFLKFAVCFPLLLSTPGLAATCPTVVQKSIAEQGVINPDGFGFGADSFTSAGTGGNFTLAPIVANDGLIANIAISDPLNRVDFVTDNLGCELWQLSTNTNNDLNAAGDLEQWWTPYCPQSGTLILTVFTVNTSGALTVGVQEMGGAIDFDAGNSKSGTSASPTTGSITTTVAADFLLESLTKATAGNPTSGPTKSFTALQKQRNAVPYMWTGDRCVSATGSYSSGYGDASSTEWEQNIGAYYSVAAQPTGCGTLKQGPSGFTSSCSADFTSSSLTKAITAGDLLVVNVDTSGSGSTPSSLTITDTQGNSWTPNPQNGNSSVCSSTDQVCSAQFVTIALFSNPDAVTVHIGSAGSGTCNGIVSVADFSDSAQSDAYQSSSWANGTSSFPETGLAPATNNAAEIVVGMVGVCADTGSLPFPTQGGTATGTVASVGDFSGFSPCGVQGVEAQGVGWVNQTGTGTEELIWNLNGLSGSFTGLIGAFLCGG